MKLFLIVIFVAAAVWAQPPAQPTPETVVATIGGKPVTAGELAAFMRGNPPEAQKNFLKDPQSFIERLALMRKLAEMGEKAHLDQQPEVKQALESFRMQLLANAEVNVAQDAIPIPAEDQKKYYEAHQDDYHQANVKMIFIAFAAHPENQPKGKKYLSEAEAKAKTEKLLASIQSGTDFVKLAKENSDDTASVARDADFGTPIKRSDNLPDNIKNAIFALKKGEISGPVRASGGFYLFRMESLTAQPYDQVRDQIFMALRQQRFNEWLQKTQKGLDVKIVNPDFFKSAPGGGAASN